MFGKKNNQEKKILVFVLSVKKKNPRGVEGNLVLMVGVNGKRKTVRLSPVLTLLSCNGSICVLAFSLSSGLTH